MIFSKDELSEIFNQRVTKDIGGICVDSNNAKTDDLFVALKGEKTDGHNFIRHAMDNGAVLAISEKNIEEVEQSKIIKVESSREALLELARYNVARSGAKYIGVTGSIGKTTTKNLIHHIISSRSELENLVYVTQRNFNSQIGLPICAATMPRNTKIGIFEMGMSAFGEIKKLVEIVQPSISVITKICEAHAAFFDSILDIARAKSEIFETARPQEAAIIPADSPYTSFLKEKARENDVKHVFTFGLQNADAKIVECNYINDCFRIDAEILGEKIKYEIRNNSESLINNSLSAILCAHLVSGIAINELADCVNSFDLPPGRGADFYLKNRDIILIDDAYNACSTSVKSAIRSISNNKNRRKILIIGDMRELGRDEILYHENLSATVDKFGVDMVFACGSLAKRLFDNLIDRKKGIWCENSAELAQKISEEIQNGDCILVKGSNSMKMQNIVNAIKSLD
jgi:UDP-N-acetylmuramoyl-tripeptide--D-alanyl-D-alanine ligase